MEKTIYEIRYDVAVIGGGVSGLCAAMAAARHGAKTVLVQDRPVLGGNASSEIRMHICGADKHGAIADARESGIIEELLLENRFLNPQHSFSVQDAVFWNAAKKQKNLDLYLNTRVTEVKTEDNKILSVFAVQTTSEKQFRFFADYFIDATGDGYLGFFAGAEYMYGREDKSAFGEADAVDKADGQVMGSSLMFTAKDTGHPVTFVKPEWAYTFTEEDLKKRPHQEITSGYWWIELSGALDPIDDAEEIRDELTKTLYGIWDHIKNKPGHNAENYALDWVGFLPGKRESRRLKGDYVLTENDLGSSRSFPDAVAYGGWDMDVHVAKGILSKDEEATVWHPVNKVYDIPYRSLYSVNIKNLFLAGRAISATHIAFGSTRVMGTCAVVGQAVGTAAALAVNKKLQSVKEVNGCINELQQTLLKDGCYIPSVKNEDPADLAKKAKVSATSFKKEGVPQNVINGFVRNGNGKCNAYISDGIASTGERLTLKWDEPITANSLLLRFDSNFGCELTISLSQYRQRIQRPFPTELVKDYDVELYLDGRVVKKISKRGNIQRCNDLRFENTVFDRADIIAYSTHGAENISLFEVRVYDHR